MASEPARTGRLRQRYEGNYRLVSGCIPYRVSKEENEHSSEKEDGIEVLMVSSPKRDDLVFPKGGWEDDETKEEAACREAFEEAGVKGNLKLKIKEAFRLCRYEWMREALEEFLRVMAEDQKIQMSEEIGETPSAPVSNVMADCQIISSSCYVNSSSGQHHVGCCNESIASSNFFKLEIGQTAKS
ncbi:hypothetical protein RGQ29_011877 [Quercus rubra]|uniref:Nudix hydrolase domain-containing protein n=1 Tax=Quercus rubra TaxID=3512 RepID=A0AAN7FY89_QUERU|nr:hypothetical protein RGQ29_011877 [Quercus rubra]